VPPVSRCVDVRCRDVLAALMAALALPAPQAAAVDRRERLRKLALETIDLSKDPYLMRNHLGQNECRLCLTVHPNEGNYLAHTQGRRHQENLAKRAAKEHQDAPLAPAPKARSGPRKTVKIGRPGYRVTKQYDPDTRTRSLLFQVEYPEIEDVRAPPRHRFMSSYEQKVEGWDKRYQYLVIAAEPYEVIAFKVPNAEVDKAAGRLWTHWHPDAKVYSLQVSFKAAARAPAGLGGMVRPERPVAWCTLAR